LVLVLAALVGAGLLVIRSHDAEARRQAIRQGMAFVADHEQALMAGTRLLQRAGPLSGLASDSPIRDGRPVVRTSSTTGARNLGPLGGPCDYLLAEHDRIAAEHHFTRVVAIAPDAAMAIGMLRRWSDLEIYLRACVAQDEPAMGGAADALVDDLPAFQTAQEAYARYLSRS
jgi:hypothetical protein